MSQLQTISDYPFQADHPFQADNPSQADYRSQECDPGAIHDPRTAPDQHRADDAHTSSQPVSRAAPFTRCPRRLRAPIMGAAIALLAPMMVALGPTAYGQDGPGGQVQMQAPATVNINTATMEELSRGLTGIGGSKAEAIVRYREQFGPFESVDELSEVTGIGDSTVERNRARITLQ